MLTAFVKQLVQDGKGKFTVARIQAETQEALAQKRDIYLADDWQDATEEEYRAQFADRTAPVESDSDKALGGEQEAESAEEASEVPPPADPQS